VEGEGAQQGRAGLSDRHREMPSVVADGGARAKSRRATAEKAQRYAEAAYHGTVDEFIGATAVEAYGAAINARDPMGRPPLVIATSRGHVHCVEAMLNIGADIDGRDTGGSTALLVAAESGQLAMTAALLRRGASMLTTAGKGGLTAEDLATAAGHRQAAALLRKCAKAKLEGGHAAVVKLCGQALSRGVPAPPRSQQRAHVPTDDFDESLDASAAPPAVGGAGAQYQQAGQAPRPPVFPQQETQALRQINTMRKLLRDERNITTSDALRTKDKQFESVERRYQKELDLARRELDRLQTANVEQEQECQSWRALVEELTVEKRALDEQCQQLMGAQFVGGKSIDEANSRAAQAATKLREMQQAVDKANIRAGNDGEKARERNRHAKECERQIEELKQTLADMQNTAEALARELTEARDERDGAKAALAKEHAEQDRAVKRRQDAANESGDSDQEQMTALSAEEQVNRAAEARVAAMKSEVELAERAADRDRRRFAAAVAFVGSTRALRFDQGVGPLPEEVKAYARYLKIPQELRAGWLAEEALVAPVPYGWSCHVHPETEQPYFYHKETKSSSFEHPIDQLCRSTAVELSAIYWEEKADRGEEKPV